MLATLCATIPGHITPATFIHTKPHFILHNLHIAMPSRVPTWSTHHIPPVQAPFHYSTSYYVQPCQAMPFNILGFWKAEVLGSWDPEVSTSQGYKFLECWYQRVMKSQSTTLQSLGILTS